MSGKFKYDAQVQINYTNEKKEKITKSIKSLT